MKTAKQLVYDFVQQNAYRNEKGIDTLAIANELGMLRTNASALLNELVKEGKLIKTSTRPVYYRAVSYTHLPSIVCFNADIPFLRPISCKSPYM